MPKKKYKKGDSKLLNAWAFYDWANSVYPLVISSAVFPIYYGSLFIDDLYVEILGFNFKKSNSRFNKYRNNIFNETDRAKPCFFNG